MCGRSPETKSADYQSCTPEALRAFGVRECAEADQALDDFATLWRHGGSPLLRSLVDAGTVELLGGPLAHPFQPLLAPRLREFALREGLADAQARLGLRNGQSPTGIWAPECAYAPGMEHDYAAAGVTHFMVDGPSLHGDTALGRPVGDTDVTVFGRDLQISYRVWSPKSGYPGHAAYRDFHTYDHLTGLKPARVTGRNVPSEAKAPYDPDRADHAIDGHVADFVDVVRKRLLSESERIGRPAHVVAAFDTELFGHWWYEGPTWLQRVLRALPEAGVQVGTLSDAIDQGFVGSPVALPPSSWGSGQRLAGVVGRQGGRSGPAQQRSGRHRPEHRRQSAGADDVAGRAAPPRPRCRSDPARDPAHRVQRLAVHGEQGFGRRLRPLPRAPARTRHPRDRRGAGVGPSRQRAAAGRGLEPRRRLFGAWMPRLPDEPPASVRV